MLNPKRIEKFFFVCVKFKLIDFHQNYFFYIQLGKMKKSSDALHKEIDQCKEMIWAKDKALEVSCV